MADEPDDAADRERRLAEVLAGYLQAMEAGAGPDRERLFAAHPGFADELAAFLDDEDRMFALAGPFRSIDEAAGLVQPSDDERDLEEGLTAVFSGSYALQGEIARGGMGVILKGHDAGLGRDLAIKVLRCRHEHDPDARRRFVEEAQISGQLQHPGIVPVHGLSALADGRPFFAMKLVQGRTLASLLAGRAGHEGDRTRFLQIFEQVCQTMAYAHAQGVIHRDLKPSNVMVGAFGEVHVMDWGLAKGLARGASGGAARPDPDPGAAVRTVRSDSIESGSQAGAVIGTPAYMAPEQARGEVDRLDERADVFGLGAMLCEILTGVPPRAAEGELTSARERLACCGADDELLALAHNCLATAPDERPRNAGDVAARLAAYLSGVQDRLHAAELARAEAQARAAEEWKRRRLAVVLAATIVTSVVLIGGGWLNRERGRLTRAARVDQAVAEASGLSDRALQAPPGQPGPWSEALVAAQRAEALLGDDSDPPRRGAVAALVERSMRQLREAERDRAMLARLDDIRESQLGYFGGVTRDTEYASAFRLYGIDIELLDQERAADLIRGRPPAVAMAIASALDNWADLSLYRAQPLPSRAHLIALARVADPDPWRGAIRALLLMNDREARNEGLLRQAKSAQIDTLPVASITLLAAALVQTGHNRDAVAVLRAARVGHADDAWINHKLAVCLRMADPPEPDEVIRFFTAAQAVRPATGHALAHTLQEWGRPEEAIGVYRDVIRLRPDVAEHRTCLGRLLIDQGRRAEAQPILQQAAELARAAVRRRTRDPIAHYYLGRALRASGDLKGAMASYREALSLWNNFPEAHINLGEALSANGERDGAIAEYRAALRLRPGVPEVHNSLGRMLRSKGDLEGAVGAYRAALQLRPGYPEAHNLLGHALQARGERDAAIAEYRAALRLRSNYTDATVNLANALLAKGDIDSAIPEYRAAARRRPASPETHFGLGAALATKGLVDDAIVEYREALRLRPDYPEALFGLGYALHAKHDIDAALESYRLALHLRPDYAEAHNNLGRTLEAKNQLDAAIAEYREAARLRKDFQRPHVNLAAALRAKGEFAAAIAEYREALRLRPDDTEAHCGLGVLLQENGDLAEALRELERGYELGARDPHWSKPSAEWLRACRRLIELDARLPAILRGDDRPADATDWAALAQLCAGRQRPGASARLWSEAFSARPELAQDTNARNRFLAARSAALAGVGVGQDEPPLDEADRARWRRQALDWLRAELAALVLQCESAPPSTRPDARKTLDQWCRNPDLAALRDEAALMRLPDPERASWQAFWADAAQRRAQFPAAGSPAAVGPEPTTKPTAHGPG